MPPPNAQLNLGDWLNVSPDFTGTDHAYQCLRDAVLSRNPRGGTARPVLDGPDFQYVTFGKLCCRILRPLIVGWGHEPVVPVWQAVLCVASLLRHVRQVLRSRTIPQVRRITAVSHVAFVAGIGGRPDSGCKEERNPMGIVVSAIDLKRGIVLIWVLLRSSFAPLPAPAISVRPLPWRLINVGPKSNNILFGKSGRRKMRFRHGVNLLYRLALWNGSFGAQPSFEPA